MAMNCVKILKRSDALQNNFYGFLSFVVVTIVLVFYIKWNRMDDNKVTKIYAVHFHKLLDFKMVRIIKLATFNLKDT